MLPDCMQGPSEPCAGYTAQSASIAALEAELAAADDRYSRLAGWYGDECKRSKAAEALLQAGRDVMAVIHGDGGHYREAHGDRKAADDAINIIYKLRADLNDARIELNRMRAGEMPGGWTAELESQIAARHAERERREAAEALLHEADKDWVAMGYAGWLEFNKRLLTHFARYKD